ncbi:hypothetical protein [Bradyrhizobium roseum]|uniref:hypothetical protein n=1 Tax=Bradyrhizobium roseum TaxID=3056648 RepID=UPI00262304F8|nr:hypothetical protein [Bradyrhizobium roseus]WKA26879.1 hypothetical protein QUH67_25325 [Bradyrhizobium roseus]
MSTLSDREIVQLTRTVAQANNIAVSNVSTSPTIDWAGNVAIEIKIVLSHGSSAAAMGQPSAMTVSDLIRQLADKGEERLPIVRYEEQGAP